MATYYRWRKSTVVWQSRITNLFTLNGDQRTLFTSTTNPPQVAVTDDGSVPALSNGVYTLSRTFQLSAHLPLRGNFVAPQSPSNIMYTVNVSGDAVEYYPLNYAVMVSGYGTVKKYEAVQGPGTSQGYVYSTSSTAYPNGGVQDGYYYDQRTTVTSPTAPTGLTYPNPITTPTVTVSWNAATSNVPDYPVDHYLLSAKLNDLSNAYAVYPINISGTSGQITIPSVAATGEAVTSVKLLVSAIDTNGLSSGYTETDSIPIYFAPTLTVPQMVMQGQQATISWTAIEGADSYTLQRKANTDADWTQVYSGANLSYTETVGTWTSLQYRVQGVFDGTPGGWATSGDIQIVSASALVISGSDGDLGILTSDVSYTVSSDGSTELTVTETINGTETRTFTATNGATNKIPVVDLPTGYGTISITASTNPGSGVVSVERNWTYTKAAITFPDAGSVADLTQQGKTIWAKTIAEAVRTPSIWGGNLGLALEKLANAVLYDPETGGFNGIGGADATIPMVSIETGIYVGTGTYGENNPNRLTFKGKPRVVFIVDHNYPSSHQLMRVWMFPCFAYNRNNNAYDDPGYFNIAESFGNGYGQPEYIFAKVSGTTLMWYGEDSAGDQINQSTYRYYYFALTSLGGAST